MFQLGAEAGAEICPATLWKTKLNFVTLTWNFIPRYRAENHYSNAVLRIRNKKKSDPDPQKRFKKILNKKKVCTIDSWFLELFIENFLNKVTVGSGIREHDPQQSNIPVAVGMIEEHHLNIGLMGNNIEQETFSRRTRFEPIACSSIPVL